MAPNPAEDDFDDGDMGYAAMGTVKRNLHEYYPNIMLPEISKAPIVYMTAEKKYENYGIPVMYTMPIFQGSD